MDQQTIASFLDELDKIATTGPTPKAPKTTAPTPAPAAAAPPTPAAKAPVSKPVAPPSGGAAAPAAKPLQSINTTMQRSGAINQRLATRGRSLIQPRVQPRAQTITPPPARTVAAPTAGDIGIPPPMSAGEVPGGPPQGRPQVTTFERTMSGPEAQRGAIEFQRSFRERERRMRQPQGERPASPTRTEAPARQPSAWEQREAQLRKINPNYGAAYGSPEWRAQLERIRSQ